MQTQVAATAKKVSSVGQEYAERAMNAGGAIVDKAIESSHEVAGRLNDAVIEGKKYMHEGSEFASKTAVEYTKVVARGIRQRPFLAVLIASGVGAAVATLWVKSTSKVSLTK